MKASFRVFFLISLLLSYKYSNAQLNSIRNILLYGDLFLIVDQYSTEGNVREVKLELKTNYFQETISYFYENNRVIQKRYQGDIQQIFETRYQFWGDSAIVSYLTSTFPTLNQKITYRILDNGIIISDCTILLESIREEEAVSFYVYAFSDSTISISLGFTDDHGQKMNYRSVWGYKGNKLLYRNSFLDQQKIENIDFRIEYNTNGEISSFYSYLTSPEWPSFEPREVEYRKTDNPMKWEIIQPSSQRLIGVLSLSFIK